MRFLQRLFGGAGQTSGDPRPADRAAPALPTGPRDIGPFDAYKRDRPIAYMKFLSMAAPDVQPALSHLSEVLRATADSYPYIEQLLSDRNWRPQLVAAAAVLLSTDRSRYAPALWSAFDSWSWVAPQLAVTLYLSDLAFCTEARRRIMSRCAIAESSDPPSFVLSVSAKNVASLLRVLSYVEAEAAWVASELGQADVKALIAADRDRSGDMAEAWLKDVRHQFAIQGCDLGPIRSREPHE